MAGGVASPDGVDRRTVVKRAGIVAGTTVWPTPLVQSLSAPALANGSGPAPDRAGTRIACSSC